MTEAVFKPQEHELPGRPLWRAMQEAYFHGRSPGFAEGPAYAEEILAIAAMVGARTKAGSELDPHEVVEWLQAEAERARRGE